MEDNYGQKVSDAASDVAGTIQSSLSSGSKKTYPAPKIPDTPSESINSMLELRCGHTFDNPVKFGIASYIALVFTAITRLYDMLHKDSRPSHTMWMAACGVVSAVIVTKVLVVYQILVASAFLIHYILYYLALAFVLFGIGLGVAGAVFFEKNSGRAGTGFGEKTKSTIRSTTSQMSREYTSKAE